MSIFRELILNLGPEDNDLIYSVGNNIIEQKPSSSLKGYNPSLPLFQSLSLFRPFSITPTFSVVDCKREWLGDIMIVFCMSSRPQSETGNERG